MKTKKEVKKIQIDANELKRLKGFTRRFFEIEEAIVDAELACREQDDDMEKEGDIREWVRYADGEELKDTMDRILDILGY